MSTTENPTPQLIEASLPNGIQEVISKIPDNLPVFKGGVVKAAQLIIDLDKGIFKQDRNGFTGNEDVDQFLMQTATMGFIDRIYKNSKSLRNRFNPDAIKLPPWLIAPIHYTARFHARPLKEKDLRMITDKWVKYGEKVGRRGKSVHPGEIGEEVERVFVFDQFRKQAENRGAEIIDEAGGNAKIYADGAEMLKLDSIEAFLNYLKQHNLHPHMGKINLSAQKLVFYYKSPIPDVKQLLADAKTSGLTIRGPAQDIIPIIILPNGWFNTDYNNDNAMSNDSTLNYRGWEHGYKVRGYEQTAFFCSYINQLKFFWKNPAAPYQLTAVRVNWQQDTLETQKTIAFLKERIKIQTELDAFVPLKKTGSISLN